jgi:hypothetical protein
LGFVCGSCRTIELIQLGRMAVKGVQAKPNQHL